MADQDMRLRLVVRRNGLPELRLMWHVQPNSNPTISKLLEQLNEQIPLEGDHWGLEDYVVELHDNDGTEFECLHYQLVRSVLKPDDRVFIRALERDDHFRRRISGRNQISSDGRHLIDGIPFGQPRLRTATTRPNIYIPPLKRARLAYTLGGELNDLGGDTAVEDDAPLLLTNGESRDELDGTDSDADDADFTLSDVESSASTDGSSHGDRDEEEEEEEEEEDSSDDEGEEDREHTSVQSTTQEVREPAEGHRPSQSLALSTLDRLTTLRMVFPTAPIDLCEQVLGASGGDLGTGYKVLSEAFSPQMSQEAAIAWRPGNGIPGSQADLAKAPKQPSMPSPSGGAYGVSTNKRKFREESPVGDAEESDYENNDSSLLRKYDHAGFPPGTITSGKGLAHMAAVSASLENGVANGNSETTSTTLKALTDEPINEEEQDDTSSSGDSSSSTSSDESDSSSEEASRRGRSSSESNAAHSDAMDSESSSNSSEASSNESDESDNDSDSDGDSDSGPEEHSSKMTSRISPMTKDRSSNNSSHSSSTSSDDSSDSSSDSSDSSDESSDNESTDNDSSSESEEDNDTPVSRLGKALTEKIESACTVPQPSRSSPRRTQTGPAPIPVPPGAGKESTKRRNARRRAAKVAKRNMQAATSGNIAPVTNEHNSTRDDANAALSNEAALFEAKRKALLDALASGGIEVGPSGETEFDLETNVKQKHTDNPESDLQHDKNKEAIEVNDKSPDNHQVESSQKRRRIDSGAGRRLVLGALGIRNPKNKDEEEILRNRLRVEAQQEANRHVSSRSQPTTDKVISRDDEQDPASWKLKLNYRAVECCQDNIELTPAPFPFQLRWDPQQQYPQGLKRGKRGGQSKRAQRNQDQYYENNHIDKKRKRHNSSEFLDNEYNGSHGTGNGNLNDFDVTLNYDDEDVVSEPRGQENDAANATSQITDLDDLPSLPKDVSTLPTLRPGEAQVGMVITWLKWTCSSATSWQPQLSRVTAIVANVNDDAATLKVCLAKRDRYLDSSEKRYDHTTGQRIYDRFEAPDLHEDGEENNSNDEDEVDEGYRDISWANMNEPRILQQPLAPTNEFEPSFEQDQVASSAKVEAEPPQSSLTSSRQDTDAVENSTEPTSSPPDQINEANLHIDVVPDSIGLMPEERQIEDSLEPSMEAASKSTSHHDGQRQQEADSMSDISQISSPSRQLHETASQAMSSNSPPRNWNSASSVELGETPPADNSSFIPLPPPTTHLSHTQKKTLRVTSFQRLGRQPDFEMEIDNHGSDLFNATDDIDPHSDRHEQSTPLPERNSLTPIATKHILTPIATDNKGEDEINKQSPSVSPSLASLSSLSSLWCTAPTSRNTQSSLKTHDSPVDSKFSKSRISRDLAYEAAMRKLDEQDDDWSSLPMPASSSVEVKKENLSQFHKKTSLDDAISPPPRRRQPFTIPPGSQVVELSSDSEPAYSENYADDEIDETYTPKSESLPKGEGWVKKNQDVERAERRKTRKWAV
ncbi:hypothetical protein NPX13_g3144 [Xylaria arbuscula]|uniref:DUF7357 domain-containing protein n=1 Tax=Xylaria arbuscula TaxID=114810 RepID=A0A9W8NJ15_9PEZI|nr:hypothetical protein NPX13_g3144 [Xylaria arbuscula]